jgi:FAD/FMN-containing dehydrogenase
MSPVKAATLQGTEATLADSDVQRLSSQLHGSLHLSGSEGYEESRTLWNAMIDRRPALIVQAADASDVVSAVNFARQHQLLLAVRGGGHNIAGNAVCQGGLMIDLSRMNSVRVDRDKRRASVGPGALLGDLDRETQSFGLATPLGINSTTGVAGLTLGGGFGWLSRKYGMTIDCLVSAEVVTADGRLLTTSADQNADLFWALRGGGGNFGVVTTFEFQLYPVGPQVYSGLVVFPFQQAKQALQRYRQFVASMPDELSVWFVTRQAPPLPFLPQSIHGKEVAVFALCYAGRPEDGERAAKPVLEFGDPVGQHLGVQPYTAWQSAFDPLLTKGARNYWKSHNFSHLPDGAIDTLVEYASKLPSPQCEIFIGLIGGQTTRVAPDAMAYSHRDTVYVLNVHGRWEQPADDAKVVAWAREFFQASAPYATGGVYVNFMTGEETDRVRAAYGPNYQRLAATKQKYDPSNLFRLNQNVPPRA